MSISLSEPISLALGAVTDAANNLVNAAGNVVENLTNPEASYTGAQKTIQKYNEVDHEIDLYLDNGDSKFYINPAAVLNMTIDDTLVNWVVDASITFMYLPDDAPGDLGKISGQSSDTIIKGAKENADGLKTYQFRADGFDKLRISLCPISQTFGEGKNQDVLNISSGDPKWTLSYIFSVYDVEDVNDAPGLKGPLAKYLKCLKLSLRDIRCQVLKSANIEYSTSYSPDGNPGSMLANGNPQLTLKTGLIMKEILDKVLTDEDLGGDASFGFRGSEDWDEGGSEIFYTSPAQWSALDDINYVYGQHTSTTTVGKGDIKDFSLLYAKRSQTGSGYISDLCLGPVSKLFETALDGSEAGEDQIEHFFVTSHTTEDSVTNRTWKAPFSQSTDRDLKTFKFGQIISYSYVDISPEFNTHAFTNTPVYSVDIGQRIFDMKFTQNTVEEARDAIGESYISKLFSEGGSPTSLFLPTIHTHKSYGAGTKAQGSNVFPVFSLNGEQNELAAITRQKNGIAQLLYTGLFHTSCICFTTFGLTHREPGKFIGIDDVNKSEDTDYNNKVFGQYFIIKVVHGFEAGAYINSIYALKLHRVKQAQLAFPNTI